MLNKIFGKGNQSPAGKTETINLTIDGMTCDHCATGIEKRVSTLAGVTGSNVNYTEGKGSFKYDSNEISEKEIVDTIKPRQLTYRTDPTAWRRWR